MSGIPDIPFFTDRFSPRGGGIDFLGLRQVNLHILETHLIPGVNNQTADFGAYCLATWIPWKFRELSDQATFTLPRYRAFQEAVEIAIAFAVRNDSPANRRFGAPRTRIGVQQKLDITQPLTFKDAQRTDNTSLYAAPLYGPSLRYLNLIAPLTARAVDDTATGIPLAATDDDTSILVQEVERSLRSCESFDVLNRADIAPTTADALDDLALHGLSPAFYRSASAAAKRAFLRKLLRPNRPGDPSDIRRLTTRLICETIPQGAFSEAEQLRRCWHTGLLPTGSELTLSGSDLQQHRQRWSLFQSRQIQRTILEIFLRCFELGLADGAQSVRDIIAFWRSRAPEEATLVPYATFEELVRTEAAQNTTASNHEARSEDWNARVHGAHPQYDDIPDEGEPRELWRALRMLARWWIRMQLWVSDGTHADLVRLGDRTRWSLRSCAQWVTERLAQPFSAMLEQIFSECVFSQHVKVALARFDGQVQRLRFTLGDTGIIPTAEARAKIGDPPGRMADRLEVFLGLLLDLGVLERNEASNLAVGANADATVFSAA